MAEAILETEQRWETLQLRLRTEQHEALRRQAFERRESLAALVRQAVDLWLVDQNISLK